MSGLLSKVGGGSKSSNNSSNSSSSSSNGFSEFAVCNPRKAVIACGSSHSAAITRVGKVVCWGTMATVSAQCRPH
jgi:alpha-tubulin suppressor-like RCC1 family protein